MKSTRTRRAAAPQLVTHTGGVMQRKLLPYAGPRSDLRLRRARSLSPPRYSHQSRLGGFSRVTTCMESGRVASTTSRLGPKLAAAWLLVAFPGIAASLTPEERLEYRTLCRGYQAVEQVVPKPDVQVCSGAGGGRIAPEGCAPNEQQVGHCVATEEYFSKPGSFAPRFFYTFFSDQDEPCAHDPASAVAACKWHCEQIFAEHGFDVQRGAFTHMSPADPRSLSATVLDLDFRFDGVTPLEACVDNGVPPNRFLPAAPFLLTSYRADELSSGREPLVLRHLPSLEPERRSRPMVALLRRELR